MNRHLARATRLQQWFGVALGLVAWGCFPVNGFTQEAATEATAAAPDDYLKRVKPLLKERCYACHGGLKQEANLRLDTIESILKGGDSGPAVVANDADKSLIVLRVATADVAERMPPEHEGEPFNAAQVAVLRNWIATGPTPLANEQPEGDPRDHWAFKAVVRPNVPTVQRSEWVKNPIDAFIAERHERLGLIAQPEAPRVVLLRRLTLDLIGLPPTPEEVAAVEADQSSDWYERAVKRLLADPRHGERWGRHWMDVWRYSDWWGLGDQLRRSQKHIWHWRDWIIESINADMPYSEMVRLMLAGDEVAPRDLDRLRATGYLARNFFIFNRNQWMDETVEHVAKGFLGLTFNCAKCHDHKYDPITHADYYRLRAFFEPYHVRTDVAPGQADLTVDGVPRVFDAVLDAPTYRLIRGDEATPDKSTVIAPGVPAVLEFAPLNISEIDLPAEAYQPEQREWVGAAHRQAAAKKIASLEAAVPTAKEKLAKAEKHLAQAIALGEKAPAKPEVAASKKDERVVDKFETLDPKRWTVYGGEWVHEKGRLEQRRDGAQRASLRWLGASPRDFDVSLRFTTLGGSQWRSVGVVFDCTQPDPSIPPTADDSEQVVYVSAHEGGRKVQASWRRGSESRYPAEGAQARPVALNQEHVLHVQVRGTLINASLDGTPAVTWRTPLERRDGAFQIMTFDALAVVHEFAIAPLGADVVLRESGPAPSEPTSREGAERALAEATIEVRIAEASVAAAQAELLSIEARDHATLGAENDADKSLARAAALAERRAAVAQAQLKLVQAELRLARAVSDKRDAVTKEVAAAKETLDKAIAQEQEPGEQFTRLAGAQWATTRFLHSSNDDAPLAFPARSTGRRRALAEWIVDPRNPLTARVAVNQIWSRHFGAPLVPTTFDFGRKGQAPTHPELLDWLASELIDNGWSMKHIHKLIVESEAYRMHSTMDGAETNAPRDMDNVYLWRRIPSRLESQAVRDSLLALAGVLDQTQGGPPVAPQQQADSKRRSLYFFHSNNERNQFLTTFDEALVTECYRREQSIVPQQALAMTNSKLVLESAGPIAEQVTKYLTAKGQETSDDAAYVRAAFVVLLAAEPTDAETAACLRSIAAWRGLPDAGQGDAATKFARTNLVWVLLNHNDFVTVR